MSNQDNNIKKFLDYLISKDSTSATDKMVYVFTVHNPAAYEGAQSYIFPYKTSQPGSEALNRLKEFVADNKELFELPVPGHIDLDEVDYNRVFEALFL